jgi:uncharacterized delta-60 repeat protein
MKDNVFVGNTHGPSDFGAALYLWEDRATGPGTVTNNVFRNNVCGNAGGNPNASVVFVNFHASPLIANNVFANNNCGANLLLDQDGDPTIINNTFVGGDRGTGIRMSGNLRTTPVVRNNIVSGMATGVRFDRPSVDDFDHNLVGGNTTDYSGVASPTGSNGNIDGSPEFVDLAGSDLRLSPTSPAIDAGSAESAPTVDFDGSARPLDGPDLDSDSEHDMGAFEADGTEPASAPTSGEIDTAWAGDGTLNLQNDYFVTMAPVGSDRLFAASYREAESLTKFRVSKYEASAAPSPDFGTSGSGTTLRDFTIGGSSFPVLLEPAGSALLVVGEHHTRTQARLGVTRLKADGTYDPTFSGDGRALYKVFTSEHDVVTAWRARVLNGGKIGLAVAALDYDSKGDLQLTGQSILRLNSNGSADTSFSTDARIPLTLDYSDVAFNLSGSVYAGRQLGSRHELRKFSVAGNTDTGFAGGVVQVNCGTHRGANLTSDPTGRPILMCVRISNGTLNLGLFRFTTQGDPDYSYSNDGKTALITPGGSASKSWTLEFDSAGQAWAAIESATDPNAYLVFSLNTSGTPNGSWSSDGQATVTLPSNVELGDLEKGSGRVYIEDFPSATAVRITAVKA